MTGAFLFPVAPAHYQNIYSGQYWFGAGEFFAPNPPSGAVITYYLPSGSPDVQIAVADPAGKTIRTVRGPSQAGINRTCWDLRRASAMDTGIPLPGNCTANIGRAGPVVLPGKYTLTMTAAGTPPLTTTVTVLPDPNFAISDADRRTRETSLMSAYALQQQLVSARDTYQLVSTQIGTIRANLGPAGDGSSVPLDRVAAMALQVQGELTRTLTDAYNLESAIDGYQGLPTAQQLRELDWAWQDATAGVTALNRLIQRELPRLYDTVGGKYSEIPPAPLPVRTSH